MSQDATVYPLYNDADMASFIPAKQNSLDGNLAARLEQSNCPSVKGHNHRLDGSDSENASHCDISR